MLPLCEEAYSSLPGDDAYMTQLTPITPADNQLTLEAEPPGWAAADHRCMTEPSLGQQDCPAEPRSVTHSIMR